MLAFFLLQAKSILLGHPLQLTIADRKSIAITRQITTDGALEELTRAERSENHYQVVVLDHHLPGMDGLELAQAIRNKLGAIAPVMVMLSSHDCPLPKSALEQHGIAGFDLKPTSLARLRKLLLQAVGNLPVTSIGVPAKTEVRSPDATCRPVLVAEDNVVNQKVAIRMLAALGYRADVASNGGEAIERLRGTPYEIVFMDVQMPEMDGLEATRRIRQAQAAREFGFDREIRIIAMTANAMSRDREVCLDAGMDDYIAKPLTPASLRTTVERCTRVDGAVPGRLVSS